MATGTTENTGNPSASKATSLFGYTLLSLLLLSAVVVTFVAASRIPSPPLVAPTAVSATVRNASNDRITADFDVTFLVLNDADKAMAFDYVCVHVQIQSGVRPSGSIRATQWREQNSVVQRRRRVGERDDIGGFGLRANATYRGKAWTKRRIPITVWCESVKVPLSFNATAAHESQVQTVGFVEDSGFCWADGPEWTYDDALTFYVLGIFLLFALFSVIIAAGLEPNSTISFSLASQEYYHFSFFKKELFLIEAFPDLSLTHLK